MLPIKWEEPPAFLNETPAVDQPIAFFPDDLPDLDMTAGGWEKDEIRTALIVARRHLHLDSSTLVGSLSNV